MFFFDNISSKFNCNTIMILSVYRIIRWAKPMKCNARKINNRIPQDILLQTVNGWGFYNNFFIYRTWNDDLGNINRNYIVSLKLCLIGFAFHGKRYQWNRTRPRPAGVCWYLKVAFLDSPAEQNSGTVVPGWLSRANGRLAAVYVWNSSNCN